MFKSLLEKLENHKISTEDAIDEWQRAMFPGKSSPHRKMKKLREEVDELEEAISDFEENPCAETRHHVAQEAADVALVCAGMLKTIGLSLSFAMHRKLMDNMKRAMGQGKPIKH